MAIYNQSWLHTILNDLGGADVNENVWQSICNHYGITETVNGTWLQALCQFFDANHDLGESWIQSLAEDFGATGPVNGSWIQALAMQFDEIWQLIDAMITRADADLGIVEAIPCLEKQLNDLSI